MNASMQQYVDAKYPVKTRTTSESNQLSVLADIYREDINMVIWQRSLSSDFKLTVEDFLKSNRSYQSSMVVNSRNALSSISQSTGSNELSEDIAELIDIYCCLFDLKQVGLRLTALTHAMCPRFHVDRVPCRLITTYQGPATEWLPHHLVHRTKLGFGNQGSPDQLSGLYSSESHIHRLESGDVALLKGELWEGNEHAGMVHRSPELSSSDMRLLLTLDVIS